MRTRRTPTRPVSSVSLLARRWLVRLMPLLLCAAPARALLPVSDQPLRTVFLVRHGEYAHTDDCDPAVECSLVALGRQQTRLAAARLDAMPVRFTSLQASTLARARETAAIIAEHFPELTLTLHDDLRECTPTTRRADIMASLAPGEADSCDSQLEALAHRLLTPAAGPADENDIVVCHGNVIRWLVCRVLDVDPTAWLGMSIANASLTIVQVRADGSLKLIGFGDSGHVPYPMTTYPGTEAPQ